MGNEGRSTTVGGLTKDATSVTVNLVNARAPKYAVRILFLKVIAYILRRGCISQLRDEDKCGVPQCNEDIRGKQEKHDYDHLCVVRGTTPG